MNVQTESRASPEIEFGRMIEASADWAGDGSLLYRWNGRIWQMVEPDQMEKDALVWLGREHPAKANPRRAVECVRAAAMLARRLPNWNDQHVIVLPLQSGYLHINTLVSTVEQKEHDKQIGLTYQINCDFDADACAPRFDRFLAEVLPNADVRGYVQEYLGYTLLPDCRYQRAMFWLGGGANGKSTLADICSALHARTSAMTLDELEGFKLVGLIDASLVYVDETPARIDEQRLKALISGGLIQIDRKFKVPLSVRPTAKWIIAGNALPAISDHSHGFWRRLPVVNFGRQFAEHEQDPMLAQSIIKNELAGVLNWAVRGLCRLSSRGKFPVMPAAMVAAGEQGKLETNSVVAWWMDDRAEYDPVGTTPRGEVYSDYNNWCRRNGMQALGVERFWNRLRQVAGEAAVAQKSVKQMGKKVRLVHLVLLNPSAQEGAQFERDRRGM